MVLSACSSYFEQLFINFSEPNQIVILKDTSYSDISAIIDFMYRGEINVSQDRLSSLLKTAENLKVKGLAEVSGDDKDSGPETGPGAGHGVSRLTSGGPPPMTMMGRSVASPASNQENNNMGGFVNINGELKKKRGRPRTLDGPEDEESSVFTPRISSVTGSLNGSSLSPILSQSPSCRPRLCPRCKLLLVNLCESPRDPKTTQTPVRRARSPPRPAPPPPPPSRRRVWTTTGTATRPAPPTSTGLSYQL